MPANGMRGLPSVDAAAGAVSADVPRATAVRAAREVLAAARAAIAGGGETPSHEEVFARVRTAALEAGEPSLKRVINGTGVLLQTNLGRAPLSERALAAMAEVGRDYSNLEYDLGEGARGSRHDHVREALQRVTGAHDGLVVNNCAAALMMVLQVFAQGREVVISRGQAVEIGGGFRIPDVLVQSGARLVEVGTTNRTYTRDYESALGEDSAALLRVHASNFRVLGFTAEAPLEELAEVARRRGVLLIDDLGSGCVVDTARYGLAEEPTVQESLRAGVHLALFSGDKLLGGPQCGIIVGEGALVERLRKHPLARALRVDKLTIAALLATLQSYADGREAEEVPLWRMLSLPIEDLRRRAESWAAVAGEAGAVVQDETMVGGGSLPGEGVPTVCAAFAHPKGADWLARSLRMGKPAIVGRVSDGRLLLDPRTIGAGDDEVVRVALKRVFGRDC